MPAAVFSLVIGGVCIHSAEVKRTNAKLRMAQAEIERLAQTAERERIARDLHDVLGHTLSLITLKSELAGKLLANAIRSGPGARSARSSGSPARRCARCGRRSPATAPRDCRPRWDGRGWRWNRRACGFEYFAQAVELDPARETVLALAMRESVTNVVRHAGARTCRITLEQTDEETRLEVRDDGRGGAAPEGIGLASMRERVEGLGGTAGARARRPAPPCGSPCRAGRAFRHGDRPSRGAEGTAGLIRVLIAEDQGMVLGALAALLELEPDIEVVGRARDGQEALDLVAGDEAGRGADRHRDAADDRPRAGRRAQARAAIRRGW